MNSKWIEYFIIKKSGLFDARYYLHEYKDVRHADVNPLMHFIQFGWREGRNPLLFFNTKFYLDKSPDVKQSGVNPLLHYIQHGEKEGRWPNPEFDPRYYLLANTDIKAAGTNPLLHYIKYGQNEGRKTKPSGEEKMPSYTNKSNKLIRLFGLINNNNIKKSVSYLRMYGLFLFLKKAKLILLSSKNSDNYLLNDIKLTIPENPFKKISYVIADELEQYNEKVSIIIPTKNAGNDFEYLLKMLKIQKGFKEIEIIIVDSGSGDNTLYIAKTYNTKVINILPEEFSHSYARNLGAENASGDYLLFTVQDALPPTETWLYELMTVLRNNDVSAVSCAEFPREDADLFYRVITWNHYNFLGVNDKDKIFKLPNNLNYISLRQNGQLSDLACLIPSRIFMKHKYRLNYAEDLDLGIRLIKEGDKIAFLGSTRIIHSHNRPAYYFLKRGYVDNLFLSDIFSDFPVPTFNFEDTIFDIVFTYNFVNEEINKKLSSVLFPANSKVIETILRETFASVKSYKYSSSINTSNNKYIDYDFGAFLENVFNLSGNSKRGEQYNGFLINSLLGYSNVMIEYLNNSYEFFDEDLIEEIKICMNKELSQLIGAHLAYCYRNASKFGKEEFEQIHTVLTEGV